MDFRRRQFTGHREAGLQNRTHRIGSHTERIGILKSKAIVAALPSGQQTQLHRVRRRAKSQPAKTKTPTVLPIVRESVAVAE